MQAFTFLGLSWWAWLALVAIVWIVAAQARKASARSQHRAEQERLAQAADAMHEGAKTRHEGGA